MSFCINCGTEIVENAKFCQKCGHSTGKSISEETRRKEFAGKIYRCPNCGESLKSFEINCPSCGYELRGTKASSAVKEFALKLEAIESKREYEKPKGLFASSDAAMIVSKTDEQKISLIKSFSVPNSKEDMLEFMILATSNMNMDVYNSSCGVSKGEKELTNAWFSKAKQVYEKAKRSYSTDGTFVEIKALYDSCNEDIKKAKKKGILTYVLIIVWIPISFILLVIYADINESKDVKEENKRLEAVVEVVEDAIEEKDYKKALLYAESIEYSPNCRNSEADDIEKEWEIRKELLIEKILESAKKDDIDLQYTPSINEDTADTEGQANGNTEDKKDEKHGFFVGFKRGFIEAWND